MPIDNSYLFSLIADVCFQRYDYKVKITIEIGECATCYILSHDCQLETFLFQPLFEASPDEHVAKHGLKARSTVLTTEETLKLVSMLLK